MSDPGARRPRHVGRNLLWLGTGLVIGPLLWGLLPALARAVSDPAPAGDRLVIAAVGWLWGATFAALAALAAAPVYAVLLFGWAWLSRRSDVLERSRARVAAFSAVLAAPLALAVTWISAELGGSLRPLVALRILPLAFGAVWGALYLPRILFPSLRPGAFLPAKGTLSQRGDSASARIAP